jgi:hypothetical protein
MGIQITHNTPAIAAAIAKSPETVLPEIDKALGRGAIELADAIKQGAPKGATSTLTNSVQIRESYLQRTIVFGAKYANYVHEGTKGGGRPPLADMLAWIRLKRITPRDPSMSVSSLAHLLRWRIAQHGIKANPFAQRALDSKRSRLAELVDAGAAAGLARVGG